MAGNIGLPLLKLSGFSVSQFLVICSLADFVILGWELNIANGTSSWVRYIPSTIHCFVKDSFDKDRVMLLTVHHVFYELKVVNWSICSRFCCHPTAWVKQWAKPLAILVSLISFFPEAKLLGKHKHLHAINVSAIHRAWWIVRRLSQWMPLGGSSPNSIRQGSVTSL